MILELSLARKTAQGRLLIISRVGSDQYQCDERACAGQSRADRHHRPEPGHKGLIDGEADQLFRRQVQIFRDSDGC